MPLRPSIIVLHLSRYKPLNHHHHHHRRIRDNFNEKWSLVFQMKNMKSVFNCRLLIFAFWVASWKYAYQMWTPLKPHLCSKSVVYRAIHYFFLFLPINIDCGHSLEPPRWGGSNEYPQSMFWAEMWKISEIFFIWKFSLFGGEIFNIFE